MFTLPNDVLATFKCDYCNNLPTRAPVHLQRRCRQRTANEDNNSTDDNTDDHANHDDDDLIVCADCSVFISAEHRNQLVRLQKLEPLIAYLRANLSPPPTPGFDNWSPTLCSTPTSPTSPISPTSPLGKSTTNIFEPVGKDLKVELTCSLRGNRTTKKPTALHYLMGIASGSGKQLCLVDNTQLNSNSFRRGSSASLQPVDIHIEGTIALMKKPKQIYANVELTPKSMPIYESIHTLPYSNLKMSNNNHPPMQEQCTTCRNGCLWRGSIADLGEHLKTCPMVPITCFFDECLWRGSEQLMKGHLYNKHQKYILDSIEGDFGWHDKFAITIQSGIIFLFKYFFYEDLDYAEIMVQGVVNRNEMDYKYNVHVYTSHRGQKVRIKTVNARCMVFNKCVLQKGLQFNVDDLYDFQNVSYSVDITKIL